MNGNYFLFLLFTCSEQFFLHIFTWHFPMTWKTIYMDSHQFWVNSWTPETIKRRRVLRMFSTIFFFIFLLRNGWKLHTHADIVKFICQFQSVNCDISFEILSFISILSFLLCLCFSFDCFVIHQKPNKRWMVSKTIFFFAFYFSLSSRSNNLLNADCASVEWIVYLC